MFNYQKLYRLRDKAEFQFVFAKARKLERKCVLLLYRENHQSYPRLGFALNKRYLKRAVDRNLFRRIVRDSFRHHKDMISGFDIIILMRSGRTLPDKEILRNDIDGLWQALANLPSVV